MILYPCAPSKDIIHEAVRLFLSWTGEEVHEMDCLYPAIPMSEKDLASLRVINFESPELNEEPFPVEIDFERRKIEECGCGKGVVYAGIQLATLLGNGLLA